MAKMTMNDGTVIEMTVEEMAELERLQGGANGAGEEIEVSLDGKGIAGTMDAKSGVIVGDLGIGDKQEVSGLKVGDKVRLLSGGGAYPLQGYENGKIYEVIDLAPGHEKDGVIKVEGGEVIYGYPTFDQVEKADPKPGDKIRITDPFVTGGAYEKGDVLTVRKYIGGTGATHGHVTVTDDSTPIILEHEFELLIAEADEEEEAEAQPSLTIGDYARIKDDAAQGKLNHGDIVEIVATGDFMDFITERVYDGKTEAFNADELEPSEAPEIKAEELFEKGDVIHGKEIDGYPVKYVAGVVKDVSNSMLGVRNYHGGCYAIVRKEDATLVAKKEDRKDL